jgi:hypothetical protein
MNVDDPRWVEYEARFRQLAETAKEVPKGSVSLDGMRYYLCLYGENGLAPQQEFEMLEAITAARQHGDGPPLCRIEVDTAYWQDTVLFVP